MIASYYPSQPYTTAPESPFVKIGEVTHHYSTGTQYEYVYSDDPKSDIPNYLDRSNFSLAEKFRPTMVRNGVECRIKPFQNYDDTHKVYLLVPVADPSIKIGERRVILSVDHVKTSLKVIPPG